MQEIKLLKIDLPTQIASAVDSLWRSYEVKDLNEKLRIYSSIRGGATPALNALATLLVLITFAALTIGVFGLSIWRKRHGEQGGFKAALADLTRMGE